MQYVLFLATGMMGFICLLSIYRNLRQRNIRTINKFLIIIFCFQSVRFIAYGLPPFVEDYSKLKIRVTLDILNTLIMPCYYLYFVDLIDEKKFRINKLMHLVWVPLSLLMIYLLLRVTGIVESPVDRAKILFSTALIFLSVYAILGYRLLYRYSWKRSSESNTADRQIKIIRNWSIFVYTVLVAMVLKGYLAFSVNIFNYDDGSESMLLWIGALLWMALFIKLIITPEILYGYNIFNKFNEKSGIRHLVLSEVWSADRSVIPIENDRDKKVQEKVAPMLNNYLHRIENKLLFTDVLKNPDFGYEELAAETGIPSSHLNFIFRYHARESFNDCKKLLRIRESVKLLQDDNLQALTFEAIAQQVGFTSYTTFYTSFKNIMGITPLEFKNSRSSNMGE
jgi:AraC-like DNA-binding protein